MNDLKFAFRQSPKNPGFTAVAVLTLALGIMATTANYSVIQAESDTTVNLSVGSNSLCDREGNVREAAILLNRRGSPRLLKTDSIAPLDQLNLGAGLKISGSKSRNSIWASIRNGLFKITGSKPSELSVESLVTEGRAD